MPIPVRLVTLSLAGAMFSGHGQGAEPAACADRGAGAVSLRVDNDIIGSQDQGYSNGIQLMLVSANLADVGAPDDPGVKVETAAGGRCHWPLTSWLARRLSPLKPAGSEQQNLTVSLVQAIFTPEDRGQTGLIRNDRPYAAALLLGLGYNARKDNRLQTSLLQVGMVGPAARGRQAQNELHKIVGDEPFRGWDNQLGDEAVFRLLHERLQRHAPPAPAAAAEATRAWRWDAITHWGASLGNLVTQANLGGELRWGPQLPDDFGSAPMRPAGERTGAPLHGAGIAPAGAHGFVSVDARWVLRDISLDGNTFKSSHRVDRQPFVVDFGYGLALNRGPWKVVLARIHRSREFKGQTDRPVFGSVSVSRAF